MKKIIFLSFILCVSLFIDAKGNLSKLFPDGTPIPEWFSDVRKVNVDTLGKQYIITDYGVADDSTIVQTAAIQAVIDRASDNGGGVIVIPRGTFLSGSLFFKHGTHLQISDGGVLKGSDRIRDFKLVDTRIEGQSVKYFAALVNADSVNGFTITGHGTINGNGLAYWEEFWIRRQYNKHCTNLEAMRPRLVYISHSNNVTVQDVRLINSPFWTNHIYRCSRVRYLDCFIYAPTSGLKAPSSDALDIDFSHDVLVNGCYMNVNDDAVVLKGGKGVWADKDPDDGPNSNIIVQNCTYGHVHGCLTLGSESIFDYNIILRNCKVDGANRVLWLKMRADTPQHYEYVRVEGITGKCHSFLVVRPWTQFFSKDMRQDMPLGRCNNIVIKDCNIKSTNFFDVGKSDNYILEDFTFSNIVVEDEKQDFNPALISRCIVDNVKINNINK